MSKQGNWVLYNANQIKFDAEFILGYITNEACNLDDNDDVELIKSILNVMQDRINELRIVLEEK